MDAKAIQIAVARADLILCWMARVLAVVMLAALLIALVWYAREALGGNPDVVPYDITSEGLDTYTANWFIWECGGNTQEGRDEN